MLRLKNIRVMNNVAEADFYPEDCPNCGHIVVGTKAPVVCPTCAHPQSYFEIHAENY